MIQINIKLHIFMLNIKGRLLYTRFLTELFWPVKFRKTNTSWLLPGSKFIKKIFLPTGNWRFMGKNLFQFED